MIEIQRSASLSRQIVRRKFEVRLTKWPDCAEKMRFILRHELATESEKSAAARWLLNAGWSEQQIESARRR